jgi:hypothetical protein
VQSAEGERDMITVVCLTVDAPVGVGVVDGGGTGDVSAVVVDPTSVLDALERESAWLVLGGDE